MSLKCTFPTLTRTLKYSRDFQDITGMVVLLFITHKRFTIPVRYCHAMWSGTSCTDSQSVHASTDRSVRNRCRDGTTLHCQNCQNQGFHWTVLASDIWGNVLPMNGFFVLFFGSQNCLGNLKFVNKFLAKLFFLFFLIRVFTNWPGLPCTPCLPSPPLLCCRCETGEFSVSGQCWSSCGADCAWRHKPHVTNTLDTSSVTYKDWTLHRLDTLTAPDQVVVTGWTSAKFST